VVVKVQRPGLKQLFDLDLENLRILAEILDKQDEARDLTGIYQECAKILYEEIDYIGEGRNADRFRRNFKDKPWVRVPIVYWEYSSTRVLTLQYLPGVKISDVEKLEAASVELDLIASRATEAYLLQVLKHGRQHAPLSLSLPRYIVLTPYLFAGFYHADPHPGNVSVDISDGPYRGSLLYYDFGMMGEIVPGVKTKLVTMFQAIYRKDSTEVLRILTELEVIKSLGGDQLSLKRAISYFLDNLTKATDRGETIANIGEDLFAIAVDQPFRFPANFTFVLRAFSTLEGIGKRLNKDYKFAEVAAPYAQELLDLGGSNQTAFLLDNARDSVNELAAATGAMPMRIQRMDDLLQQLEAGDLKLRVRALEVERASRKAVIQSNALTSTVLGMGFLNIGTMMALSPVTSGSSGPMVMFVLSTVCGLLTWQSNERISRLIKFESEIKGGGRKV
jgi:predicted unusual protein kinase regulating ubiquinone biosynthesis (AarF/ABC1/UbiB family)